VPDAHKALRRWFENVSIERRGLEGCAGRRLPRQTHDATPAAKKDRRKHSEELCGMKAATPLRASLRICQRSDVVAAGMLEDRDRKPLNAAFSDWTRIIRMTAFPTEKTRATSGRPRQSGKMAISPMTAK